MFYLPSDKLEPERRTELEIEQARMLVVVHKTVKGYLGSNGKPVRQPVFG